MVAMPEPPDQGQVEVEAPSEVLPLGRLPLELPEEPDEAIPTSVMANAARLSAAAKVEAARPVAAAKVEAVQAAEEELPKAQLTSPGSPDKVPRKPPEEELPSPEPRPEVVLMFHTEDGTAEEVLVTYKPLGLDFKKEVPLLVTNVEPHSAGEELGIAVGWAIVSVDGKDISNCTFDEVLHLLRQAFLRVPHPSVRPRNGTLHRRPVSPSEGVSRVLPEATKIIPVE